MKTNKLKVQNPIKEFEKSFSNDFTFYFLVLGIVSLALSGLFVVVVLFSRTPFLSDLFRPDLFKVSLILHVNLSIIVWFFCILASIVSAYLKENFAKFRLWSFLTAISGISMMVISPFFGGEAIHNNYIPVLDNVIFVIGISLFLTSNILVFLSVILNLFYKKFEPDLLDNFSISSCFILLIAYLAFFFTCVEIKYIEIGYDIEVYYELLFWGYGHLIQFSFVQLMLLSWYCLLISKFGTKDFSEIFIVLLFWLNVLLCLPMPFFYYFYSIESGEYSLLFTKHMRIYGGISAIIFIIYFCYFIIAKYPKNLLWNYESSAVICSMLLFGAGGLIGYKITESNVVIPAHYHGSIIGITIALMGFVYLYFDKMNFKYLPKKLMNLQILIYFIGQSVHITGLALSGGYGALRKTHGVDISLVAKIWMGIAGIGGLLTLISGLLFVFICYRILLKGKNGKKSYS